MSSAPKPTSRASAFVSHSAKLGTDYLVFAETIGEAAASPSASPAAASSSAFTTAPLPVVVVVDGDYMFEPLVAAANALHRENKIPPVLLAGIGYGKPFGSPLNKRGRDYTTSRGEEEPDSGGARQFFTHLTGQLWSELDRRHPVDKNRRVIAGHSLGGLFALHALFQSKPFFNAAIVGAPSLWWNNHRYPGQLARFHKRHPAFAASLAAPARLFLGIGENDTESMTGDFARFEKQLAGAPFENLAVHAKRFPRHDHYDLLPVLFRAGLVALLG
jgi:predicted alpha/beta superfamily hydrolase